MQCAVIVFAKAPRAGQAKTRLAPALGADGAARLAQRMLQHAVQQALAAGLGPVDLCVWPDPQDPVWSPLSLVPGLQMSQQVGDDLGQRMANAMDRWLRQAPAALLIGTDAPALDAAYLQQAARALARTDAVFGPAADGGYVLVGLRRPCPTLFENRRWSHAGVMADARQRLADAALRHHELPLLHDIDEPSDLMHLPPSWQDDTRP